MSHPTSDQVFAGSVPELYDTYLVPLIFEPYAADLAARAVALQPARVLEVAAGTGAVTRALANALPESTTIVATDLNQGMIDRLAGQGVSRPVTIRQADALALPFPDASFNLVVCQFGAMFFPDRPKAYAEARRVLPPGGTFVFSTWDRIEDNEFADVVTNALATLFPADPPRFMARTPHGYHDVGTIASDVTAAGFQVPAIETVTARSRAASPDIPALAFCQGTPLRGEIEARSGTGLAGPTAVAAEAIAKRFGAGAVDGRIQAHVVTVSR